MGYVVGFLATYFFGFSRQMLADLNVDQEAARSASTVVAGNTPRPSDEREPVGSGGGEGRPRGDDDAPGRDPGEPERPVGV